jgi:hypothetical protein
MRKICWRGLLALMLFALVTGCSTNKVGLQPENPPFKKGMFALWTHASVGTFSSAGTSRRGPGGIFESD